jgi:hypothetical protein
MFGKYKDYELRAGFYYILFGVLTFIGVFYWARMSNKEAHNNFIKCQTACEMNEVLVCGDDGVSCVPVEAIYFKKIK